MKKKNFTLMVFLFSFFAFYSCDEIEGNYLEEIPEPIDTDTSIIFPINSNPVKKILIEDFTGHECPNCPAATDEIHRIMDLPLYENKIISVVIHAGMFADFYETGLFQADFTNEAGIEIHDNFSILAYPTLSINRAEKTYSTSEWEGLIADALNTQQQLDIAIVNEYDTTTSELKTHVQLTFLETITEELNLSIFLLENKIISPQRDNRLEEDINETYEHNHILRTNISGIWGNAIDLSEIENNKIVKSYSLDFDKEAWNINNCMVVAFVSKIDKTVLQAEENYINSH